MEYLKICDYCKKRFMAHKYNTLYCSHDCARKHRTLKKRIDTENVFGNELVYKMLLNRILSSIERIEEALELCGISEKISKEELLTVDKFCELMNIHKRTLRRMIKREEIEIVKQGNKILIPKNQLKFNK